MSEENPRMNVIRVNGITVIELKDRKILDEMSIMQIGEQLNALVQQSDLPKFVMDFSNVGHMSSSALGVLITLHKRIRESHGQLRLCNIQPAIFEIFLITRLNEIFQISESREDAIKSI